MEPICYLLVGYFISMGLQKTGNSHQEQTRTLINSFHRYPINTLLPLVSPSKMLLLSIMYFPSQILCLRLSSSFLNYAFGPEVMNYQVDFQSHLQSEESK